MVKMARTFSAESGATGDGRGFGEIGRPDPARFWHSSIN